MTAMAETVSAAQFRATCLALIRRMQDDDQPVVVTRRGKPVAVLSPFPHDRDRRSIIGALRGTVLRYDDPFAPALEPDAWVCNQEQTAASDQSSESDL